MCDIVFNDITIICIHQPRDGIPDIFFNCVINALNLAANETKYLIFCGDLNLDYSKEAFKKTLADIFQSFKLNPTTHEPTRIFTNCHG